MPSFETHSMRFTSKNKTWHELFTVPILFAVRKTNDNETLYYVDTGELFTSMIMVFKADFELSFLYEI